LLLGRGADQAGLHRLELPLEVLLEAGEEQPDVQGCRRRRYRVRPASSRPGSPRWRRRPPRTKRAGRLRTRRRLPLPPGRPPRRPAWGPAGGGARPVTRWHPSGNDLGEAGQRQDRQGRSRRHRSGWRHHSTFTARPPPVRWRYPPFPVGRAVWPRHCPDTLVSWRDRIVSKIIRIGKTGR
jgi:hypothetical protein